MVLLSSNGSGNRKGFCSISQVVFVDIATNSGPGSEWHSRGQRFDPAYLHHRKVSKSLDFGAFSLFFSRSHVIYASEFFRASSNRVAIENCNI